MHLYWTSLSHLEEGTLSSSIDPKAGSFSQETVKQVFSHKFPCDYMESRTFSLTLRSSLTSSDITTHPWT